MRALWCWSGSSIRVTGANLSTLQGVRRWLQGEAIPAQDKIQVLVEWLKVEPEVLRFGEAVRQSVKQHQQLWESGMGHWERETCEAFLRLPAAQRKTAREVILALAKEGLWGGCARTLSDVLPSKTSKSQRYRC